MNREANASFWAQWTDFPNKLAMSMGMAEGLVSEWKAKAKLFNKKYTNIWLNDVELSITIPTSSFNSGRSRYRLLSHNFHKKIYNNKILMKRSHGHYVCLIACVNPTLHMTHPIRGYATLNFRNSIILSHRSINIWFLTTWTNQVPIRSGSVDKIVDMDGDVTACLKCLQSTGMSCDT